MPFYRDSDAGTAFQALQDFTPTGAQSLIASTANAFDSNPTVLGYNAAQVALANQGEERVPAYDAAQMAKDAGVAEFTPGEGYTRDALNLLIERRRQEKMRADVMQRTPYSWTGTPLRAAGVIGASLLDPLNIAAAFVPTIAPARYAALLDGAAGAGERALIRGAVGAVQGATGMAMIEPAIYAGHQYLQDDYGMRDSLLNIAFGGAFGGGLHVIGGALADSVGPGRFVKGGGLTPAPGSAADTIARADPETRNAALQTAVGQAIDGRTVDVAPILDHASPDVIRAAGERQATPEAIATADVPSAKAADARIAEAPKDFNVEAAQAELTAATQRLQGITRDMEAAGVDPRTIERLNDFTAHDEALADANKLGNAARAAAVCGQRAL